MAKDVPKIKSKPRREIGETEQRRILVLIELWPLTTRITWERLLDAVEKDLRHRWTRQATERHEGIKQAFQAKQEEIRVVRAGGKPRRQTPEAVAQEQRIGRLESEVEQLRKTLRAYDDRFIRYVGNALRLGIRQEELERDLLPIDRGTTDDTTPNRRKLQVVA